MMVGYKGHSLWDQEQDRYDAIGSDMPGAGYDSNSAYDSGASTNDYMSSDYKTGEGEDEEKEEIEKSEFEKTIEENFLENKEGQEEQDDEQITKKAAEEIMLGKDGDDKPMIKRKESKSIEEAISKAIKKEKELIYVD